MKLLFLLPILTDKNNKTPAKEREKIQKSAGGIIALRITLKD